MCSSLYQVKTSSQIQDKKISPCKNQSAWIEKIGYSKKAFVYEVFTSLNDVMDTEVLQNISEWC